MDMGKTLYTAQATWELIYQRSVLNQEAVNGFLSAQDSYEIKEITEDQLRWCTLQEEQSNLFTETKLFTTSLFTDRVMGSRVRKEKSLQVQHREKGKQQKMMKQITGSCWTHTLSHLLSHILDSDDAVSSKQLAWPQIFISIFLNHPSAKKKYLWLQNWIKSMHNTEIEFETKNDKIQPPKLKNNSFQKATGGAQFTHRRVRSLQFAKRG